MKFKVGDRVIMLSNEKSKLGQRIGKRFIVTDDKPQIDGRIQGQEEDPLTYLVDWNIHPDDFEFDHIWDSPLCKALR